MLYHRAKVMIFPHPDAFLEKVPVPSLPRWQRLCGCQPLSPATCSSDMMKKQMRHSPGAQL